MPTNSQQLVLEAKRLEKLQAKRRKLMKDVRNVDEEIKTQRRHIKALSSMNDDDQLPPKWRKLVE